MIQSLTDEQKKDIVLQCFHSVERPAFAEPDFQAIYENHNFDKPLDPSEFSVDRGWWYRCRVCDGQTRLRTKHPYCQHCGFSQNHK